MDLGKQVDAITQEASAQLFEHLNGLGDGTEAQSSPLVLEEPAASSDHVFVREGNAQASDSSTTTDDKKRWRKVAILISLNNFLKTWSKTANVGVSNQPSSLDSEALASGQVSSDQGLAPLYETARSLFSLGEVLGDVDEEVNEHEVGEISEGKADSLTDRLADEVGELPGAPPNQVLEGLETRQENRPSDGIHRLKSYSASSSSSEDSDDFVTRPARLPAHSSSLQGGLPPLDFPARCPGPVRFTKPEPRYLGHMPHYWKYSLPDKHQKCRPTTLEHILQQRGERGIRYRDLFQGTKYETEEEAAPAVKRRMVLLR